MIIETKRLILRNYTIEDLDDYWDYVTQEHVGPRCGWSPYTSKEAAKERLELESNKPFQFAIELKENKKVIGSIELMEIDREWIADNNYKEIGCLLSETYWGKGIMTEAMQAIIKYCFENLDVNKIYASYFEPNKGSGRVQEKCGLTPYKTITNHTTWYLTGQPCDLMINLIKKEDYLSNPIYKNIEIYIKSN